MNRLELSYAKMVFRLNTDKRMSVARKLASLLRNDFTLMDALGRIEKIESNGGKNPHEPFAIVMRQWQKNLERGMSFSDATRGWMTPNETLLLTSANISSLVVALENLERMVGGVRRIRRAFLGAVAYPLFLFALTIAIIIMVGIYLVPPLASVAGNGIVWRGIAASLIWVSDFSANWWHVLAGGFIAVIVLVALSLPNWSGHMRAKFDDLPPWNIYKIQVSVGWLTGLAALVAGGVTLGDAMRMLTDNSNRYLRSILSATLRRIANGENLGRALDGTGRGFPNAEIIGDLEIYSDMNDFDKNLTRIANDYLDESVRRMDAIASALNNFGIILVSVIIAWVVFGTFQMQDQITATFN